MAERRMFTKKITESDAFLDMPLSSQCLYFHLNMNADDDGFVGNPKTITRMIGASADDLKILISKRFVIGFPSGVIVVKHWKMNNTIQNDRHKKTQYTEEMNALIVKPNNAYTDNVSNVDTDCIQNGSKLETQYSIDETKLEEINIEECIGTSARAHTPTLDEISEYVKSHNLIVDSEKFFYHYSSKNWTINGNPISNWKHLAWKWDKEDRAAKKPKPTGFTNFEQRDYDFEKLEKELLGNQ